MSSVGLWLAGHEAHDMSFNRTREAHRKKKLTAIIHMYGV